MIFVTVGTHEQQFDRLVKYMDQWAKDHDEEVIIQTGFSTYEPVFCNWKRLFAYQEMLQNVEKARLVITHGGPSSFILPLQNGKTPIVVPRMKEFQEHVNDHQVKFCRQVEERMGTIILVERVDDLEMIIEKYDNFNRNKENKSNNSEFCSKLERMIDELFM